VLISAKNDLIEHEIAFCAETQAKVQTKMLVPVEFYNMKVFSSKWKCVLFLPLFYVIGIKNSKTVLLVYKLEPNLQIFLHLLMIQTQVLCC
jgi:hypothetical protein